MQAEAEQAERDRTWEIADEISRKRGFAVDFMNLDDQEQLLAQLRAQILGLVRPGCCAAGQSGLNQPGGQLDPLRA